MAAGTIDGLAELFEMRLNETAAAEDVGEAALSVYAHAIGEESSLDLLVRYGFLGKKSGRLTNGGALLFARNPGEHLMRTGVMVEIRAAAQGDILRKRG